MQKDWPVIDQALATPCPNEFAQQHKLSAPIGMIDDKDIWRAANKMIELYELDAGWQAALRADHLLEQG